MRKALLLLPLLLLPALGALAGPGPASPLGVASAPPVVSGPLLTPPNPDVYAAAPFVLDGASQPVSVTPAGAQEEVVTLLVEFADVTSTRSPTDVATFLFDDGPDAQSMRSYYRENSYGQTDVVGSVSEWVASDRSMAYYGEDGNGIDDANGPIYCLTVDAVLEADPLVDFAQYDNDGDGVVDHLIIVHAGDGQETSTNPDLIWSHRWVVIDASRCRSGPRELVTDDGVRIEGYIMAAETSPLGVFVHEFGHDFGLPDLYDTTGATVGIGVWGVMGTGSWTGSPRGSLPAHFTSWSKAHLGWLTPTVVTAPLLPADIPQLATDPVAYKLPVRESLQGDEYFLVENRQRTGFDGALPGTGLLIWHVDETQRNNNAASRRLVDLEEADDGRGTLFADNPTQGTDPWADDPDGFTPDSVPSSNENSGARTGWKVTGIGPSGSLMQANISKGVALDLAVRDVRRPAFVDLDVPVTLEVPVTNRGLSEVTNGTLALAVYHRTYDPASRVYEAQEALPALGEGEGVTLTYTYSPNRTGRYLVEAVASLAGDEVPENNHRFVHFQAGVHLFVDDLEGGVAGWSPDDDLLAAYRWQVVDDGDGYGAAHSPTRSWRFGFVQSGTVQSEPYLLEAPPVALEGETPRLLFFQRYRLTTEVDEGGNGADSDVATVEVSFDGGPWTPVANYTGVQLTWQRTYLDLAPYADGAEELRVRFAVTADVQPQDGGWWIDDVAVVSVPLAPAAFLKPLDVEKEVVPGGSVSFLFIVVNVGDLGETFHFRVDGLPNDWSAAIGPNATLATPVEEYETFLDVDQQRFLSLVVTAPLLAERGALHRGILVALTPDEAVGSSFIFSVQVPVGFGFNLSGRTLAVALLIGGVMLAIAVVLTAVRRRETY